MRPDLENEEIQPGWKIELDSYSGPVDLLLYLIKRDEVDIYDIPIARVTEQYLQYIEVIRSININLAGEFLVMAATLMEVKSRMLLPREEVDLDEIEDPRSELVRQLLEYKRFREAAGDRVPMKVVAGRRREDPRRAGVIADPQVEASAGAEHDGFACHDEVARAEGQDADRRAAEERR